MSEDKKKTKVDPTKIIVKGPKFEFRNELKAKTVAIKAAKKAAKK